MSSVARLVIRQRSAVILLAIIVLIGGLITALNMQLELFPKVSFDTITVVTAYPGAGPDAVLRDVTKPIEGAVAGVPGIDTLSSTSTDNASIVTLRFTFGTNIDQVEAKVNSAVNSLQLPDGVQHPRVSTLDFSAFPIQYYAIRSTRADMSLQQIYAIVSRQIKPQIEQIPGVAAADVSGGVNPQILVHLHPVALARFGITPAQVDAALQASSVRLPAGTVTDRGLTLPVIASGMLHSLAQLRSIPVGPAGAITVGGGGALARGGVSSTANSGMLPFSSSSGRVVRVGDVATVTEGHSDVTTLSTVPGEIAGIVRFDGKPAISLTIRKNSDANIVEVANGVKSKLDSLQRQYPQLRIGTIFDSSKGIKSSVSSLVNDGLFGAVFAVIIIFLFLLTVRTTLVTAISIPLSILTAIIVLKELGYTLNIMTISGVAVAVGRVVDDAIVVLENVYRHVQEGDTRLDAAIDGTREVARAIIGSTATTVAVFLPIGFIGGILGQFFQPFALTVTFALIASLIVSLTVVPALGSLFIVKKRHPQQETTVQRLYVPMLNWALSHRAITVITAAALFFASLSLAFVIPKGFFPPANEPLAQLSVNLPAGSSLASTTAEVARVERLVLSHQPGIQNWETIVGYDNASAQRGGGASAGNAATLLVTYGQSTDMTAAVDRLRSALRPYQHAGTFWSVQGVQNGPPNNVDVLVRGADPAQIVAATQQVTHRLAGVAGLVNLQSTVVSRKPQIQIIVDPSRAIVHGLTPATAALQLRQALTGQVAATMQASGNTAEVPIFVQVDRSAVNSLSRIRALRIGTPPIALGQIASVSRSSGPVSIPRLNQQNIGEVTAAVNNASDSSKISNAVQQALSPLQKRWDARNVTIEQAGIGKQIADGFKNMGIAMLVAVGMVYLIMVLVFRSLLVPFVILFCLPLAVIGAMVALAVTGRQLDMSALIGVLMLIGVVVTNAVVLLDLVQQRLEGGLDLHDALLAGGRTRVRPILMTAAATILALMPLAIVGSSGGLIAANLATVVIGGLLTSTLLTLVVVPVIYSLFASLRRRITGRGLPAEQANRVRPELAAARVAAGTALSPDR